MSLINPVPAFNFTVFLFNARPFGDDAAEIATTLGGAAVTIAKSLILGAFSEVGGLNAECEVEEYREGGRNAAPLRFAKFGTHPNLVLKRGVTPNTDLWDWHDQVVHGRKKLLRKNGVIILTDKGGGVSSLFGGPTSLGLPVLDKAPIAAWFFREGLPQKLQGPNLNAKSNEIAIETLEIAHHGLFRVGPLLIPGAEGALTTIGI